jgi:hypothetical protein
MIRAIDPMRLVGWAFVALGLCVAIASPFYADRLTRERQQAWFDAGPKYTTPTTLEEAEANVAESSAKLRMIVQGQRPEWLRVSPWPGVAVGAGVACFGILLLAIRRPD